MVIKIGVKKVWENHINKLIVYFKKEDVFTADENNCKVLP